MVPLELIEATADAAVFRDECVERVSRWMIHGYVFGELLVVARVVDAIAELFVAARDES